MVRALDYNGTLERCEFEPRQLIFSFFRAIFDLSNKIALLILCRMYALYVKKKKTKTEIVSKE